MVPSIAASPHDITDILNSPSPVFGAQDIEGMYDVWQPEQHAHLLNLMPAMYLRHQISKTTIEPVIPHSPKAYDLYNIQPKGIKEWLEVPQFTTNKNIEYSSVDAKSLENTLKHYEAILKASKKVGIPKSAADISKANVKVDTLMKTALLRRAANSAGINLAVTAVFDIRLLIDGEVKAYLMKLGVSGLYGGAVSGCSAWINHPIFGNSAVLGVVVGSAFGLVSLASTGDWARFGKNIGLNIASSAGGYGVAYAGAYLGTLAGGPIGAAVGGVVGGIAGGFAAHWMVTRTTNIAEATDHEINSYYERIKEEGRRSGWEPDPTVSPRDFVRGLLNRGSDPNSKDVLVQITESMAADIRDLQHNLARLRDEDAARFDLFVERLREAVARRDSTL
jgi:hypothetical protein